MDGVLVIDKPVSLTSNDVVQRIKRTLGVKKVGHLGTLDPLATGVLPLVINRATKFSEALQGGVKEYAAVMRLGFSTDTYDSEGAAAGAAADISKVTEAILRQTLSGFLGEQEQTPPMYSAVKQNGVPLYKLARKGVTVERKPKAVTVHSIELVSFAPPFVSFSVACSRGTYVRSICHDIGARLGVGAHLTELKRVRSGAFSMADAVSMDAGVDALIAAIKPLEAFSGLKVDGVKRVQGAS
ncbi:MAG: tRNA pseudouridine(55) synthase TruB [Deltaproteobacteria bacterium]|nr:tRNA pseudouridine(55) synthase TruB [Deltaproteobacteria bacterium]